MKNLRYMLLVGGILTLMLGLGFAFNSPLATVIWPWPDGPLSYLFIGSILVAISVAMLWISWSGEWGAAPAGSLNILVIALTTTLYFFYLAANGRWELIRYGIAGFLCIIASIVAFRSSQKYPLSDERPTPMLVRISFGIFVAALLFASRGLILRLPIFPWKVNADSSVIFGCIFLGDAFYFLYGLFKPRWYNALGQLLSFLAYDLVLIIPFLGLLRTGDAEHRLSLIIYILVLVYSGTIAIYFLFINKETRNWSPVTGAVTQIA